MLTGVRELNFNWFSGLVIVGPQGSNRHVHEFFFDVGLVPRMTTGQDRKWDEVPVIRHIMMLEHVHI